jgi:sulfide:quinone oxidoreductase
MAELISVNASFGVAPQIDAKDVAAIAAKGYRTIIDNRPDHEGGPNQPEATTIEAEARRHGLAFRFVPVVSGQISDSDIAAFDKALAELPKPVLAYCRSGTRSITLWALAEGARQPADALLKAATQAGYDLGALRGRIEARGAKS